jgi:hypothetical protein
VSRLRKLRRLEAEKAEKIEEVEEVEEVEAVEEVEEVEEQMYTAAPAEDDCDSSVSSDDNATGWPAAALKPRARVAPASVDNESKLRRAPCSVREPPPELKTTRGNLGQSAGVESAKDDGTIDPTMEQKVRNTIWDSNVVLASSKGGLLKSREDGNYWEDGTACAVHQWVASVEKP